MMRVLGGILFGVFVLVIVSASAFGAGAWPGGTGIPACHWAQPNPTIHPASAGLRPVTGRNACPPGAHTSSTKVQQHAAEAETAMHFATITVSIDPQGTPLAAYQFELRASASFKVLGLENAGHQGFSDPPYYDLNAAANGTDRLIIADYSLLPQQELSGDLQTTAIIHAVFTIPDGDQDGIEPEALIEGIALTLTAAADTDGEQIDADISYNIHFAQRQEQE